MLESFLQYSLRRAEQTDPFILAEIQTTAPFLQICEVRDPDGIKGVWFKDVMENKAM